MGQLGKTSSDVQHQTPHESKTLLEELRLAVRAHKLLQLHEIIESLSTTDAGMEALVNMQDDDGHSLLHLCVLETDVCRVLLFASADKDRTNDSGLKTIFATGHSAVLDLLARDSSS